MNCKKILYSKTNQKIPSVTIAVSSLSKVNEILPLSDALRFPLSVRPCIIQIAMIIYP